MDLPTPDELKRMDPPTPEQKQNIRIINVPTPEELKRMDPPIPEQKQDICPWIYQHLKIDPSTPEQKQGICCHYGETPL